MLKTKVTLEHLVGSKVFHFICDNDSSLDHVKEALSQFMGHVVQIENDAKSKAEAAASEKASEAVVEEMPQQ